MIISFQYPAGQHERWAESAAQGLIGQTFTAKIEDREIGVGKVLGANVIDEGRALDLTIEWPDGGPSIEAFDPKGSFSISVD